jgi:hypothetical protein
MENKKEKDLIQDFFREVDERNEILKMPMNSLTELALENVEKSELSKRVEKHYKSFSLVQFLNHCSVPKK